MIWISIALLTGLAVFSVLAPLARRRSGVQASEVDRAFYEAQVAEIERDNARGLIGPAEAEAARAEAARRLIRSHEKDKAFGSSVASRRLIAVIALVLLPAIALGLYFRLGNPDLEDRPLLARKAAPAGASDIFAAIDKIEKHLAANPDDARGWEVLAPVYLKMGRAADAAKAWKNVIRIAGPDPVRYVSLGEALVFDAQGRVSNEALQAFEAAAKLEPKYAQARFYMGLAAEQSGELEKARDIWTKLLADAPPDASWAAPVRERIAKLGPQVKVPAPDDLMARSLSALPKEDQQVAIRGMVDRLANRLKENGRDTEGWLMLVNAYSVLKDKEKAREALANARKALGGDAASIEKLNVLARQLGLEG